MRLRAHFRHHSDCLIVPEKREEDTTTRKRVCHHFEIIEEAKRSESGFSVLRNFKVILENSTSDISLDFYGKKFNVHVLQLNFHRPSFQVFCIPSGNFQTISAVSE